MSGKFHNCPNVTVENLMTLTLSEILLFLFDDIRVDAVVGSEVDDLSCKFRPHVDESTSALFVSSLRSISHLHIVFHFFVDAPDVSVFELSAQNVGKRAWISLQAISVAVPLIRTMARHANVGPSSVI